MGCCRIDSHFLGDHERFPGGNRLYFCQIIGDDFSRNPLCRRLGCAAPRGESMMRIPRFGRCGKHEIARTAPLMGAGQPEATE